MLYNYMQAHAIGFEELSTYLSDTSEKFQEAITAALRKVGGCGGGGGWEGAKGW
jgi:hypothetical protein